MSYTEAEPTGLRVEREDAPDDEQPEPRNDVPDEAEPREADEDEDEVIHKPPTQGVGLGEGPS